MRTAILALLLTTAALAQEPMVETEPKTLTQAVADGVAEIVVTQSGTLTAPLHLKSGQKLKCSEGVTITCEFTEATPCIEVSDNVIEDCAFVGVWKGGDRVPNWRTFHGVGCYGARVTLTNVTASGFDDGFYAGPKTGAEDRSPCHFAVSDSTFDTNFRQGSSVTSGVGTFERVTFSNTIGISPQAGCDVEPSSSKDEINVEFKSCKFTGNVGPGLFVNVARFTESSKPVRVIADENCLIVPLRNRGFELNGMGAEDSTPAPGLVEYRGVVRKNNG